MAQCRGIALGYMVQSCCPTAEARYRIYLPAYRWVLDHCLQSELHQMRQLSNTHILVLLDYEVNTDIDNCSKPLSHAALIAKYLTDQWPPANS